MLNNKYVVKSLTPWMMDELIAFSSMSNFDLILLRVPTNFYKEGLNKLNLNGVNIYIKPISYKFSIRKLIVILKFIANNFLKFNINYNAVLGIKSIFWFFKLDVRYFTGESNIHAQFATQAALVSLLVKYYYSNKPLLSFTFHAYDIYFSNNWFNLLVKNSHKAFSISLFNIKYVKNNFIDSDRVFLSRLGVFRNLIQKHDKNDSNFFVLGLMSWFVEKKGINYLLEAIKELKANDYKDIKLILAGDGPLKDKYLKYIEENDLTSMIEYRGKVKGQEKENFYNEIDCFILPSIRLKNDQDGIPVVLMEAIAYRLPLISTNVSGIPEICINDYNGKLINDRDVKSNYDSIVEIYNDKTKRLLFANNSYDISKEYDIEFNSKKKLMNLNWI